MTANHMNNQRGLAVIWVVLIAVIALALGAGAVWYWQQSQETTTTASPATTQPTVTHPAQESTVPTDWQTYSNAKFGFTVKYPKTWEAPDNYGGVIAPGGATYKVERADAYEYVFTFIPGKIDNFPVIITVYDLSGANADPVAVREKVISELWTDVASKKITRKSVTVRGEEAMLVTVTIYDSSVSSGKFEQKYVFIEKSNRLYQIGHSGSSTDNEFEIFYSSFTFAS